MVTIDVLEGLVSRIAQTAMNLHRPIRRLAAETIAPVITHRNLVRDGERAVTVHEPGRLVDQRAQHLALRLQLHQGELNRLV